MRLNAAVIFFINFYISTHCWHFFTTFSDLTMTNSYPDDKWVHSEYRFGNCSTTKSIFFTHVRMDSIEVLGKLIIRRWLDIHRIPTCIVLRAKSFAEDMMRSTTFNFQMCVPRISYCHTHRRFKYFYFEWYIPVVFEGGMDWEIYFFGPPNLVW